MGKNLKKTLAYLLLLVFIGGIAIAGYIYYVVNTGFDTSKTVYIYINQGKNYNEVLRQIKDSAKVKSLSRFELVASFRDYPQNVKTGRYAIEPTDNIWMVVNKLNRKQQTPVKVTFNNIRLKADLTDRISEQLMFGKDELTAVVEDSARCAAYGFNAQTIVAMFIPNTYEFYWDVAAGTFMDRMKKEYDSFWTKARLDKAAKMNLTPLQISILASIVEEECMFADEYPIVAGLYYNRLRRGQLLQADPTVKYAVGDFSLQRILNKHLEIDSPYNTYKYPGLPPGPIRIPSIRGIDAVLNYAEHKYLYMCAKEDFSGRHNFAVTHAEHNRNAARYRQELNRRKIY